MKHLNLDLLLMTAWLVFDCSVLRCSTGAPLMDGSGRCDWVAKMDSSQGISVPENQRWLMP